MDSFFNAVILNNTIVFIGTVLLCLVLVAFLEVFRAGDFSKLKKFFY